ncbi:M20/M25/M40 family metallo-hydrolase [Mucilaginibacter rubeus]|uniref:M20/M25/M40 family metallo-hydrolase n=1 Tax=Mucilaginibacter rubeus TaxID=2027860 RepID=A0AAE6JK67_9SPHI|nr:MULTISPECIES: M20/M25/M40 family metallo-hydrolase [Mucilaginibacter]QEM06360.1 M20/M25/M40 family metallo-hydrolase [Mucilaginibacter rubeus]QEM18943.1 M20/M25/M40 family metallo-hydrolase [Mucilaginibacter gossypii]QTE44515.1 M20/M25/M40 family metallo-hydrolase [Mucilaginibacter rubeus]QTE51113.1 M20/M25/M40 family metallo-hydrolase [Mucilaginibacter rubeus]QTE56199.1 M20/M25/M40 family metallo-hydrolase [Mucilaginibacter rubeus]
MKKISIITAALLSVSAYSFAQDVNKLISKDDVARIIKTLSADDMQGRATFTPGIEKAATFIEGEYKKAGLKPMAGNTGYRQNFTMVRSTPVSLSVSINGKAIVADSAFASGTDSFKWASDKDVQVVTVGADKNFRTEYRAASQSGKKTLLLIDPKFKDLFSRVKSYLGAGSTNFKGTVKQPLVFVLGKFDNTASFDVNCDIKNEELPLFNVAGILPGKTKPNEYVVFSGHYDHLGIIKPDKPGVTDSIANGADDDASGTTAVLSLAKYYKKLNNNARTLIFVAFTAEEIGEYGSQYFAKQIDADKVVAMFNIEMIGKASKFGTNSAFITGFERSDFGKILQKNLKGTAFKFYPDPYPDQNLFYRSDNASLAEVGVPAHTISTDQIDIDKLYHTVSDEFSSLDVNNITSAIRAIALSSRTIVSGQDTPTRVPKKTE